MSIVCRSRVRDTAIAASVRMTQLVGQHLQLIRHELIVIPENLIVTWTTGALHAGKRF